MIEVILNYNAIMLRKDCSRGLVLMSLSLMRLFMLMLVDCPLQILLNEEFFQMVSIPWSG